MCLVTRTTLEKPEKIEILLFWKKVIFEFFLIRMPGHGHNKFMMCVVTSTSLKQLKKKEILLFWH